MIVVPGSWCCAVCVVGCGLGCSLVSCSTPSAPIPAPRRSLSPSPKTPTGPTACPARISPFGRLCLHRPDPLHGSPVTTGLKPSPLPTNNPTAEVQQRDNKTTAEVQQRDNITRGYPRDSGLITTAVSHQSICSRHMIPSPPPPR